MYRAVKQENKRLLALEHECARNYIPDETVLEDLPVDLTIEFCDSSSCPGFVVAYGVQDENGMPTWGNRKLREVKVKGFDGTTYTMSLCEVCEDAADKVEES